MRPGARRVAAGLAVALSGCILGPPPEPLPPVAPPPVQPPAEADVAWSLPADPAAWLLPPPEGEERVDELLASRLLRDVGFRAEVEAWIGHWTDAVAHLVPQYLERLERYGPAIDSELSHRQLPASLRYLPFIESGYNPSARSRAAAVGMWQFMAPTARGVGMTVDALLDERRDPLRSTEAAADYLETLRAEFGSWFLALAAYNGGPTRTRRILARRAPLSERSDSLFWALREHFPRETREFVPKLMGAIIVASRPEAHGFATPRGGPLAFDEVTVPDATTLDIVARAADVPETEVVELNPHLIRRLTPPGRAYVVRIPQGRAELFDASYALIPAEERVSHVEHRVTSGETLSHIALRYRISVADLRAANPEVRPRYLQIGDRLTVPLVPGSDE